jgi:hypothetical protein
LEARAGGLAVNVRWAARFPRSAIFAALPLRLRSGLEVCEDQSDLWLIGDCAFEEIDPLLRRIPDVMRYSVGADRTITPIGRRIPEGILPVGKWNPLSSIAQFQPQPTAMPARLENSVPIRLVRSKHQEEPGAIVATAAAWKTYADFAPRIRLDRLRFAICSDGRALILGFPLPPLQGSFYTNRSGLLLPVGFGWEPEIEPQLLRRAMNLNSDDLAILDLNGGYELIPAETAIRASRSAVRRSLEALTATAGDQ